MSLFVRYWQSVGVAAAAATYRDVVLAMSPTGYWPHDDVSGNLADASGNGFTATVTGTLDYGQTGPTIGGVVQSAIAFDATDRAVVSETVDDGVAQFTLSFWFKATTATASYVVGQHSSAKSWVVYWAGDGGIHLYLVQTDGTTAHTNIQPGFGVGNDGNWHHVVYWRDVAGDFNAIIDGGATTTSVTETGTWNAETTDPFVIAAGDSSGANPWTGSMAHLAYWRSDIGATARATLYTGAA